VVFWLLSLVVWWLDANVLEDCAASIFRVGVEIGVGLLIRSLYVSTSCLPRTSALRLGVARSSGVFVSDRRTAQRGEAQDLELYLHHCGNLKSHNWDRELK